MLAEAGRPEEAITFYQQEAEAYQQAAGADDPLARHALLMAQRTEEAITWQRSRANATRALHEAFELMRKGRPTEGPGMFRVRAIFVLLTAEWMLEKAGRPEEAITWLLSRGKAGDDRASEAVFEVLEKARRTEKAIAFHLQATEVGDPSTGAIILCQAAEAGAPAPWRLRHGCWKMRGGSRRLRGCACTGSSPAAGSRIPGRPLPRRKASSENGPPVRRDQR